MSLRTRSRRIESQTEVVEGVDEIVLAQAEEMFGTSSPRDTVNKALREVVRQQLAIDYVAMLKQRGAGARSMDALRGEAWR